MLKPEVVLLMVTEYGFAKKIVVTKHMYKNKEVKGVRKMRRQKPKQKIAKPRPGIIKKKCNNENGGEYYTIINTIKQVHVHATKESTANRIIRCYNGNTTEKDISIRNRALKLSGYKVI